MMLIPPSWKAKIGTKDTKPEVAKPSPISQLKHLKRQKLAQYSIITALCQSTAQPSIPFQVNESKTKITPFLLLTLNIVWTHANSVEPFSAHNEPRHSRMDAMSYTFEYGGGYSLPKADEITDSKHILGSDERGAILRELNCM